MHAGFALGDGGERPKAVPVLLGLRRREDVRAELDVAIGHGRPGARWQGCIAAGCGWFLGARRRRGARAALSEREQTDGSRGAQHPGLET